MKIKLAVAKRLLREFRKGAIKAFPKETCCFLIGSDTEDRLGPIRYVEITELWMPEGVERHAKSDRVNFQDHWVIEAAEHAKETGMVVVGDLHTHPYTTEELERYPVYPDCSESERDQDAFRWNKIAGICTVTQSKAGRMRARFRWWGPRVVVEVV